LEQKLKQETLYTEKEQKYYTSRVS